MTTIDFNYIKNLQDELNKSYTDSIFNNRLTTDFKKLQAEWEARINRSDGTDYTGFHDILFEEVNK